jgi:hypothetical protein
MAEARKWRMWAKRLTWAAAILSIGAVAAALIGAIGSGQEWWHFRAGFAALRYSFFAAAAGGVLAIAGIVVARRAAPRLILANILFLLIAGGYCFFLYSQYQTAQAAAPIHDVTTNLEDYPRFYRLIVRDDNLAVVPAQGRPELEALAPRERWKAIHREAYPDLRTVRVSWSVEEAVRRAEALARERGWEVVTVDSKEGVVEAVDTSRFFRFKDNVIVRVRPLFDNSGSMIDMRSISRVGVSDIGANARRVREFLADLQAGG